MNQILNRPTQLIVLGLLACLGLGPGILTAQDVPFAVRAPDGALHLWTFDEESGMTLPEIDDVTFLPIELAGASAMDRLRLDRPTVRGGDSPAPHVRLPSGGTLYRIQAGGDTALMQVSPEGEPKLVLVRPAFEEGPSLDPTVFVSHDGRTVVAVTEPEAGGDVIVVDLTGRVPTQVVTAEDTPHRVDASTLRASPHAVWFVAEGQLFVAAPDGRSSVAVEFDLLLARALPDLVMNRVGRWVAVVVEFETPSVRDERQRHVFVVDEFGAARRATAEANAVAQADSAVPLGMRLALSPQGRRVAYTHTNGRLFITDIGTVGEPAPLEESAPVPGVRRANLLHFADAFTLRFLAQPAAGGQAQVYEARMAEEHGEAPLLSTHPSVGADLVLEDVVFGPTGGLLLMLGQTASRTRSARAGQPLRALDVLDLRVAGSPRRTVLEKLTSAPRLVPAGHSVLVVSTPGNEPRPRDEEPIAMTAEVVGSHVADGVSVVHLVSGQSGIQLDRFAISRGGRVMAFTGRAGPGLEMPVFLDLKTGLIRRAWQTGLGISPVLAFSNSDALYLGMDGQGEDFVFGSFPAPGKSRLIRAMPRGYGFPLQH